MTLAPPTRKPGPLRPLARLLLLGSLAVPTASATPGHHFVERDWTVDDGLPQGTVNAMALDHQGFLLLGTFGGLSRFNGQRFERVDLPLKSHPSISRITALAQQGELLWFGVEGGGLWTLLDGAVAVEPQQPSALSGSVIQAINIDAQGHLLVASRDGAHRRLGPGNWKTLAERPCTDMDAAEDGTIWITCGDTVGHMAPGQEGPTWERLNIVDQRGLFGGALDDEGRYWVVGAQGIGLLQEGHPTRTTPSPGISPLSASPPVPGHKGGLWIGGEGGIYHLRELDEAAAALRAGRPLQADWTTLKGAPRSLLVDTTGGLWIGTVGKGLLGLSDNIWETVYELPEDQRYGYGPLVAPQREDAGSLFAACYTIIQTPNAEQAPAQRIKAGDPTQPDRCVRALYRMPEGDILAGGHPGLMLYKEDGSTEDLSAQVGLQQNEVVTAIRAQGDSGFFVLGTSLGRVLEGSLQARQRGREEEPWGEIFAASSYGTVLDLLQTGATLWIATAKGLVRLKDGKSRLFDAKSGFPPSAVRALALDPAGRIWATTYGGGLGWVLGEEAGLIPVGTDALPDGHLSGILLDAKGNVWLHGNQGLSTVKLSELQARARDPKAELHVSLIETGEANGWIQPSMVPLPDGDLLLANVDRVVHVRVDAALVSRNIGQTQIHTLEMGGQRFKGKIEAAATLRRDLRVRFSAPTLNTRRALNYRWRLRPANSSSESVLWSEPSDSNLVELVDLEPGEHLFEVLAVSQDGHQREPTVVPVTIHRRFWEHAFVQGLALAAFLAFSIQVGRLRAREVQKRNEQLQSEIELRKRAERQASEQGAYYRTLFECGATALLLFEPDGRCVAANPQAEALLDPYEQGLQGRQGADLGLGQAIAEATDQRAEILAQCQRLGDTNFPAQVVVTRFQIADQLRVMCAVVDLSRLVEVEQERTRLRDALTTARRLEGVGRLAGGVAHDINNMMTAILGNTDLAIEVQPEGPAREFLDEVRRSVDRGSALVRELLSFGRRPQTDSEVLDPREVLDAMVGMLRRLLPDDIRLVLDLQPVPAVRIPRTALEQILLNLIVNASDAMPHGGEVRVTTRRESPRWVIIEVTDQGVGISPEIAERIFEPFFSTKPADRGTGLGLATVRDLATQADAKVELYSQVGTGTTFRLRFPGISTDALSVPPSPPDLRPAAQVMANQFILVVDDNDGVRSAITKPLRRAGYEVIDFGDPMEALRWIQSAERPPTAVISDVIMPGLNGKQMTDQMRQLHPDLGVLFVTGYAADVVWKRGLSGARDRLLEKPFTNAALLEALGQLLQRRAAAQPPAA